MIEISYLESEGPGPAYYHPTNPELAGRLSLEIELAEGESASSRAVEAAKQLAADAKRHLKIEIEASDNPADYPPTPSPTPEEVAEEEERRRGKAPATLATLHATTTAQAALLAALEARLVAVESKLDNVKSGVDSVKADTGRIPKDAKP